MKCTGFLEQPVDILFDIKKKSCNVKVFLIISAKTSETLTMEINNIVLLYIVLLGNLLSWHSYEFVF